MFNSLPTDVIKHIATFTKEAWFFFYHNLDYDKRNLNSNDEFKKYVSSLQGIKKYKEIHTDIIKFDDRVEYQLFGKAHREDLPAIIYEDGTQVWCKNGVLHRDNDMPAIIDKIGTQFWAINGLFNREDDKPVIIYVDGTCKWLKNGKLHRDNDKPAVIHANGTQIWYKNDMIHRDDLPAIICENVLEWWIDGKMIKKEVG
jgi:hypothetical protein